MKLVILTLLTTVFLLGCAGFNSNFNLLTTQDFEISKMREYAVVKQPVKEKQTTVTVFTTYVTKKELVEPEVLVTKALKKNPGVVGLVNADYKFRTTMIPLLFTVNRASIQSSEVLVEPRCQNCHSSR